MKAFQFKDLMINVAPAGEKAFCGFGTTYGCGYSCYHLTCPALTCYFYTCYNFTCHFGPTCYVYTIPQVQAQQAACFTHTVYPCGGPTCGPTPMVCVGGPTKATCSDQATDCPVHPYRDPICGPTLMACAGGPTRLTCSDQATDCVQSSLAAEGLKNQLAAIKAQLQQELAVVEQSEKAVAEALQPQTVAEVEELQGKLREALAELDKRKQELQKAEKGIKKGK